MSSLHYSFFLSFSFCAHNRPLTVSMQITSHRLDTHRCLDEQTKRKKRSLVAPVVSVADRRCCHCFSLSPSLEAPWHVANPQRVHHTVNLELFTTWRGSGQSSAGQQMNTTRHSSITTCGGIESSGSDLHREHGGMNGH